MQEIWIIDEIKTVREKKDGRRINMLETFILTLSIRGASKFRTDGSDEIYIKTQNLFLFLLKWIENE